jgi:hypothetical protein
LQRDQSEPDDPSIRPDLVLTTLVASAPEILNVLRSRLPDEDPFRV